MKGYIKQILFILLVIVICIIYFLLREKKDYTGYALKLDQSVNATLVKHGIKDSDILNQYWQEKKDNFSKWIEITKEIKLPKSILFGKLKNNLTESVKSLSPDITFIQNKDKSLLLAFGRDEKTLVKLVFFSVTRPKIAIVIDDLGYEDKNIENFLALNIPLNFSIFPKEHYSGKLAELLEKKNIPYLMHLPMEPEGYPKVNPGKAALLVKMKKDEIKQMFFSNLKTVGKPAGLNNHMGSRFTTKKYQMHVILSEIKGKDMFFFDSRTSTETVGKIIAKKIGLPCLTNDIFLDITDDEESIKKEFNSLLRLAKKRGYATAIGHVHKKHFIPAFKAMLPEFEKENVEFVYLGELIGQKGASDINKNIGRSVKR